MIIDLPSTTTSQVNAALVELRERGGAVALGRVLTLIIVTEDGAGLEDAIDAANGASREHPSRIIVAARGSHTAAARIDGQIRVGGDAGASEVIVLRLYGPLAREAPSVVVPLLLPDAPIVAWWPGRGPKVPAEDPIGVIAQRRIMDSAAERQPIKALRARAKTYAAGDTDLAWTRLTRWRAQLVAALDLPPHESVTEVEVTGAEDSPSTELLAGWLAEYLDVPIRTVRSGAATGIVAVTLRRPSGAVRLHRPDATTATLTQPGHPVRHVPLPRTSLCDVLIEELRRMEPDEVYAAALAGLRRLRTSRTPTKATSS